MASSSSFSSSPPPLNPKTQPFSIQSLTSNLLSHLPFPNSNPPSPSSDSMIVPFALPFSSYSVSNKEESPPFPSSSSLAAAPSMRSRSLSSGVRIEGGGGGGPAFVGQVFSMLDPSGNGLMTVTSHFDIPFLSKRTPDWMKKMFSIVTKKEENSPVFRFFMDLSDAVAHVKRLNIPTGMVGACRLDVAYQHFKEEPHMFQFVPNEKQVKAANRLLNEIPMKGRRRKIDGVPVFTAENLNIAIATNDGIKWYTPYFFDKKLLDSILETSVDQTITMDAKNEVDEAEPLLDHHHTIGLRRLASNTTSQLAIVGSNLCPIESLDYEIVENEFFKQDWRTRGGSEILQYVFTKWTFCLCVGSICGLVGFFVNLAVENIAGVKFVVTSNLMLAQKYGWAFGVFAVTNFVLTMFAALITAFVAPAAAGSGIPEVMAYLNGVDAPDIFSLRTLIVKVIGCIATVSSSLYVGKAGPMVHTGACIASILGQGGSKKYRLTCKWLGYFKNDRDRRDLVTCGAGAGVAAAFRAPVGGVLFALETVASWWRSALLWRAFFTTAVVAVVLRALIDVCYSGKCGLFGKGGLIMFDVTSVGIVYHVEDLPPVIILGIIGGVLGSLYNYLMDRILRVYSLINQKGRAYKFLLAAVVSITTSCCLFGLPWLASCRPCPTGISEACPSIGISGNFKKYQCPPDHYNDLASLFFNTNDDAIKNLYRAGTDDVFNAYSILLFFVTSYILGIFSYGLVVPAGLFVPIILTGATYGRLIAMLMGSYSTLDHGLFAVLGSASLLGGSMRMTVSVCVMLLELTSNLLLLPLVMMVLLISKAVADAFNSNIYELLVNIKGLPYLKAHAEPYMRQLTVSDVVTGPLRVFQGVEKVGNIVHVLRTTGHNGFPVVDETPYPESPLLFGLILRSHLLVLLKRRVFLPSASYVHSDVSEQFSADDFSKKGSGNGDTIEDIELTDEEMELFVDLHPYSNSSPYTVVETMSLAKALLLFREVGLRHLLVIPKRSSRSPIVGILTRHDFMPEHILGLHPSLVKSRSKRLRLKKANLIKFFSGFC